MKLVIYTVILLYGPDDAWALRTETKERPWLRDEMHPRFAGGASIKLASTVRSTECPFRKLCTKRSRTNATTYPRRNRYWPVWSSLWNTKTIPLPARTTLPWHK